jgi:hypothetical protein
LFTSLPLAPRSFFASFHQTPIAKSGCLRIFLWPSFLQLKL